MLRGKFRLSDAWGSRIVDQYGRPFDWEKRPMIGNKIKTGRTIQFYRKADNGRGAKMSEYRIDLDPTHQVLRITVTAAVATHELAEDCYRCVERIASRGGPYAGIWDLSGVTSTTESTNQIMDRARRDPAIPAGRTRVVVAKEPVVYGLSRMGELMRDSMGGQLQVVHSLEEAYEIVGVRPEDFTERLFPTGDLHQRKGGAE